MKLIICGFALIALGLWALSELRTNEEIAAMSVEAATQHAIDGKLNADVAWNRIVRDRALILSSERLARIIPVIESALTSASPDTSRRAIRLAARIALVRSRACTLNPAYPCDHAALATLVSPICHAARRHRQMSWACIHIGSVTLEHDPATDVTAVDDLLNADPSLRSDRAQWQAIRAEFLAPHSTTPFGGPSKGVP